MSKESKIIKRVGWIISCIGNFRKRNNFENEPDLLRLVAVAKQWCVNNTDEKTSQEILKMKWNNPMNMCFSNIHLYFNDLPDIIEIDSRRLIHAQHEYVKFGKTIIFNDKPVTNPGIGRMSAISIILCYFNVEKNISKLISEYDGGCCACELHNREVKIPYFNLYKSETYEKYVEYGKYVPRPEEKLVSEKIAVTDIKHKKETLIILNSSYEFIKNTVEYLEFKYSYENYDDYTHYHIQRIDGNLVCTYRELPDL